MSSDKVENALQFHAGNRIGLQKNSENIYLNPMNILQRIFLSDGYHLARKSWLLNKARRADQMRLSSRQRHILKQLALEHFGAGVDLLLFGSRADDDKRGGDIDLYVSGLDLSDAARLVAKINFVVAAQMQLGEQRIDVVFAPKVGQATLPIQKMAEQTGIPL